MNANIGGFRGTSTVDWPNKIVSVIFFNGCKFKCQYCHNAGTLSKSMSYRKVYDIVVKRKNIIEGVVLSGGEPLLQKNLLQIINEFNDAGVPVGIHTTGMVYDRFKEILEHVSWVGFDFKGLYDDYGNIIGNNNVMLIDDIFNSLNLLVQSNVSYEVRTTPHSLFQDVVYLNKMIDFLLDLGVQNYTIQNRRDLSNRVETSYNRNQFENAHKFKIFRIR